MQKNCLDYPVEFIDDAFGETSPLADLLKKVTGSENPGVLLVADANVVQRTEGLGTKIGRYVQAHGIRLVGSPVVLSGGEKLKADNLQSALKVVSAILDGRLEAGDCVMAMGGGALLDVAGYAAAQARGGVKLVRMPTTPAAMIDAAFADYAAVDSAGVKDALRVPSRPAAVVLDKTFAATVLDGVWRGGIGEAVRLAAACDGPLLKKLVKLTDSYRARDLSVLGEIVTGACKVRQKKGATDFALWSALRLEAMSGYKLPHGYAVAIGICIDSAYAVERQLLKESDQELICGILAACGALDGLSHSQHILSQPDQVLLGLDAWRLSTGSSEIALPAGLGKATVDPEVDRALLAKVLKEFVAVATAR